MWILATLFAAACQSMRTAYQKTLSQQMGFLHATMARSLYGLPLVAVYLLVCWQVFGAVSIVSQTFWLYVGVCAIAQIIATWLMLRVFQSGSFAMGTLLAKTEAVMAALIAIPLLQQSLSLLGWMAVLLGVSGALVMSINRTNWRNLHRDASLPAGLGSGFGFAVASVTAALSSYQLEGPVLTRAGVALAMVLSLQTLLLCSIQIWRQRDWLAPVRGNVRLASQVGILSSLGSIGWFAGFALVNPALVKTLGQIEILGTLYFSKRRFGEHISVQQWIGGALIVASVVMVALAGLSQ